VSPAPSKVAYQLHVELNEVAPAIWRRLLVPTSVRLSKLADVLLVAMGWSNSHLHSFNVGDTRYGMVEDEYPEGEIDETSVTVLRALRATKQFEFEYDFGDGWSHTVTIEQGLSSPLGLKAAICLAGENACPPDDCGGPGGYAAMLKALADPADDEHENYLEWIGEFDPTAFDLVASNALLQKI
jgi:hypothetical protein